MEHQKEAETAQDIQLLQILTQIQNPKVPMLQNKILANVFRNRGWEELNEMLDEKYYEPTSDAGNMQMLDRMMGSSPSNEQRLEMSAPEKSVRNRAMRLPM
jgi:hypothetical protein